MPFDVSRSPESDQVFKATFDRAVIGISHVSPEGRCLRFNQRLCDFLGYDGEELAACTIQDVTYPDDLDADLASVRRVLAGELGKYAMGKRYVRKDGAPNWGPRADSLGR